MRQFLGGCWLSGLRYWPRNVSGHAFTEDEYCNDASVQVLRCSHCGEYSVGWWRNT